MNLKEEFKNYKYAIKTFSFTFGILVGQMIAWFFILPLDYTYIPASFFIVRWLPISSVGLFIFYICWKTWNTPINTSQKESTK
uniref:ORF29 n=1 Tax=Nitrosopumilaceae spindle-shaped virus TaxID=3065433 RepID=A0AAT9J7C9_9VIRU